MATATLTVDLEEFGLRLDSETPLAIAENCLDLLAARRGDMDGLIIRIDKAGEQTDVNLAEGTETPVL